MSLVSKAELFCKKTTGFFINICHKTAAAIENLTNPMMVCYYHSYFIHLPVALVDFQLGGFTWYLHHIF